MGGVIFKCSPKLPGVMGRNWYSHNFDGRWVNEYVPYPYRIIDASYLRSAHYGTWGLAGTFSPVHYPTRTMGLRMVPYASGPDAKDTDVQGKMDVILDNRDVIGLLNFAGGLSCHDDLRTLYVPVTVYGGRLIFGRLRMKSCFRSVCIASTSLDERLEEIKREIAIGETIGRVRSGAEGCEGCG